MRVVGRTEAERRAVLHTIGPVWDGNEVWLLVAGGATFAAFPQWYATLFSGFYLALFLILVALIVRNVAFEFWGKGDTPALAHALGVGDRSPAASCPRCCGASAGPTSSTACRSTPSGEYTGTLFTLLNPYALLGGLATLALFLAHGAIFLEPADRRRGRAARAGDRRAASRRSPRCIVIAFLVWTLPQPTATASTSLSAICAAALGDPRAGRRGPRADAQPARAFAPRAARSSLFFVALFVDLFPHAMVSSTNRRLQPHPRTSPPPRATRCR